MNEDFRLQPQQKPTKSLNYHERVKAGLQRGGLRQVSKQKQKWIDLYHAQIDDDAEIQTCTFPVPENINKICGVTGHKETLQRHHTHGRDKENILKYKYRCNDHHDWIHKHPNKAREIGELCF